MDSSSIRVLLIRFRVFGAALVLSAISILAFLPALENGFLNWDDGLYVTDNELIQNPGSDFFRRVFAEPVAFNYHPVTILSHALDCRMWGREPRGHHLTSVLLHGVNTALVFLLMLRLFPPPEGQDAFPREMAASALTGLLFALHPIHAESVAWVSERKDLLYALFFLLSLIAYLRYARSGRRTLYLASLLLFLISLMSKPMAVTLPAVLLLLDLWPLGRWRTGQRGRLLVEKVPFLVLSLIFSLATLAIQEKAVGHVSLWERLSLVLYVYPFYLRKLVWPVDLAPFYPYPLPPFSRWALPRCDLAMHAALTLGITLVGLWQRRRRPYLIIAWGLFLVHILPVSGIVQVGSQLAADRYLYLASVPVFALVGWASVSAPASAPRLRRGMPAAVALAAVFFYLPATRAQTALWKDSLTLWDYQVRLTPDVTDVPYFNRATALQEAGRHGEAIRDFDRVLEMNPSDYEAWFNRGLAWLNLENDLKAIEDLTMSIRFDPENALSYYHRGFALHRTGDLRGANSDFTRAIELDPGHAEAYNERGIVRAEMDDLASALEDFSAAIALKPDFPDPYINRGRIQAMLGNEAEAAADYGRAAALGPPAAGRPATNAYRPARGQGENGRARR